MKVLLLIVTVLLVSCSAENKNGKLIDNRTGGIPAKTLTNSVRLVKADWLSVTGDFDGDGKADTLYEHSFSTALGRELDSVIDANNEEWEDVMGWYEEQRTDIFLANNKGGQDTLHLGSGMGLYCLLNIGDNNRDGRDEIAVVVNYADYSRINSCNIYELCNGRWKRLKQFGVHEGAFDVMPDSVNKGVKEMPEYLERRGGKWMYKDYNEDVLDTSEDAGKMKSLSLNKCIDR